MKVSKSIKNKMKKLVKLATEVSKLSSEIDNYFIEKGYDIELLRSGNGRSLEELEYGNDIIDKFCNWIESEPDELIKMK